MFESFLSLSSGPVIQPDVGFFDKFLTENPNYARTISLGNTMLQLLLFVFSLIYTFSKRSVHYGRKEHIANVLR